MGESGTREDHARDFSKSLEPAVAGWRTSGELLMHALSTGAGAGDRGLRPQTYRGAGGDVLGGR